MRILLSSLILLITASIGGITDKHSNTDASPKASRESIVVDDTKIFNQIRAEKNIQFREHQAAIALWNKKVEENRIAAQKAAARQRSETRAPSRNAIVAYIQANFAQVEACIIKRESGGNPVAKNPRSTASGLYQFLDSTWANYGGFARAMDAPASVQREKFVLVMNNGYGYSHWNYPPRQCWPSSF